PPDSSRSFLILKDFTADSRDNLSDAVVFNGHLLQATWAVAHHSGNRELVRRHWPVIRRLFTTGARVRWAGFGAADDTALCDEAATAIAFARLAYLAGDADTYQYACGIVARQLLL